MRAAVLTLLSVLLIVDKPRSFVDSAALSLHPNSADDLQSAFKSASGLRPESQALDEDVRELHNLKPFTNNLISMQRSSSRVYSDVNGHKESHVEDKQEVSHNGQKVESYRVEADAKDVANSATPATHVHAEVEVPAQGVHRTFDSADKRKSMSPGPDQDENLVEGYRSYAGVQYSPLDMAEYVFWTGDEKGVTMAIEEFLQDGMMTREEAIAFLQDIKINLDYLQNHYAEERMQKQELAKERANQLQKALTLEKMTEAKLSGPSDLAEVRQQMRDNLRKKNAEVEEFSPSMSRMASLTDQDYQDLLERLRVADFLYTEYSLEEVIYQLAKVMFSQSLNRGTTEAQEALQKFTGFLEAEAENGRISRSLEKKVLDVLIASLTDTLSEHPELVGAARASLGDNIPDSLLVMNKDHKTGVDASKAGLNKHRFQNSKVGLSDAGPAMKKSVTPPKQHPNP